MKQLKLVILAAGEGKRIKPIITSKPLLPFLGKTILERVAASAQMLAPAETVIVVNPRDKEIVQFLFPAAKIVIQSEPNGMAGAVLAARSNLAGPTVIINGDDLIEEKIISEFSRQIRRTPERIILTGIKSKPDWSGGYFDLQGLSLRVREKTGGGEWFKLVLDYFPKIEKFLTVLKDDYEAGLNRLNPTMIKTRGKFYQLKFPWQILDLTAGLLTGKNRIDPTTKVMFGTEIINSYLGPNVIVGQNCLIRDSVIEAGTTVGFGSEIARSYIGPKNNFHRNYIGDSVIEGGSNFGAGAVLANFRFDHRPVKSTGRVKFGAVVGWGAQVGVNAALMPGTSLAAGETVGPGTVRQ